jgi:hypothetical protein
MKLSSFAVPAAGYLAGTLLFLSACAQQPPVTHNPQPGYAGTYQEGYYDRDHSRYWHDNAWHDCVVNDVHCHG